MASARELAKQAYERAIAAAHPARLVPPALARLVVPHRGVTVVAIGKGAVAMAEAATRELGGAVRGGVVITKRGYGRPVAGLEVIEAAHPVPDASSLAAGRELIRLVSSEEGPVLALVSGGASALAAVPAPGVSFDEKVATVRALASAGASIRELNTVRKHLSAIKGGRLAAAARGGVVALLLSDVIGDDPATIGSGLASPDPTTYADALAVLRGRGVAAPPLIEAGARGEAPETPKHLTNVETHVIGGPDLLVDAAVEALAAAGAGVREVRRAVDGPVEELVEWLVDRARRGERGAVIAGGEPTIRLPARTGRGGRAQHAALACARGLVGVSGDVAILCGASDGTDGPTADAGGVVDAGTWARARAAGVDPDEALARHDAGRALEAAGDLVTTGPTGTNVCDLFLVVAR